MSEEQSDETFRPGMEPDYNLLLERTLKLLQGHRGLSQEVNEWRVGDLPETTLATDYPAVYVAMSRRPQAGRTMIGAAGTPDQSPAQHIVTEMYVVCLATGADAAEAQLALYKIVAMVKSVLLTNNRLADDGSDPLCGMLEITEVPRVGANVGTPLEGMTVMVRVHNYRYDPASTP